MLFSEFNKLFINSCGYGDFGVPKGVKRMAEDPLEISVMNPYAK